jgi:hypothetical protein
MVNPLREPVLQQSRLGGPMGHSPAAHHRIINAGESNFMAHQLKPTPTPPDVSPPPEETPAEMLAFWLENMC